MASTTKKDSKKSKAKPRRPVVKTSVAEQAHTIAELRQQLAESLQRESATSSENVRLFQELQARNAALGEALRQQTATGEILRIISTSLTDLQPVFDVWPRVPFDSATASSEPCTGWRATSSTSSRTTTSTPRDGRPTGRCIRCHWVG